jgi:tRNA A-37 threonylcarbamoyl transferase component Bud32
MSASQGVYGLVTFRSGRAIKQLKEREHENVFFNEIRILQHLESLQTPSQQGWMPRNTEWKVSRNQIHMQRIHLDRHDGQSIFPSRNPSSREKNSFCKMVKTALRNVHQMNKILCHLDLHTDNIMIRRTTDSQNHDQYQLVFIDYGMALLESDLKEYFSPPMIQLLKLVEKSFMKKILKQLYIQLLD